MATKCPRCFVIIPEDTYVWSRAPRASDDWGPDPVASAYLGAKLKTGPYYKYPTTPGSAPVPPPPGAVEDAQTQLDGQIFEVCPTCHFELPDGWRDGQAICIAMAGARATGKSLYIAVLVKQLQLLCDHMGIAMQPATRNTAASYEENYQRWLFVERGLIPATRPVHTQTTLQREPLIYGIGTWAGVRRYLVLRDVAGEDLEVGDLSTQAFEFFANADGVFFMFDPLRIKSIRLQLQDLIPQQTVGPGDPRNVLNNVMMAIGNGQPRLAVILSKFDALRALQDVQGSEWSLVMSNAGAAYMRDTSDAPRYDEGDGRLLHEEVRSLLMRLDARPLLAAVENPASQVQFDHRYFVVSALGQPPSGNRLHMRGIAPFRCADPVRWVTSSFGVL